MQFDGSQTQLVNPWDLKVPVWCWLVKEVIKFEVRLLLLGCVVTSVEVLYVSPGICLLACYQVGMKTLWIFYQRCIFAQGRHDYIFEVIHIWNCIYIFCKDSSTLRDRTSFHNLAHVFRKSWSYLRGNFVINVPLDKEASIKFWKSSGLPTPGASWQRSECLLVVSDRMVRLLLFLDRISNCTNLFWPELNRTRHRIFAFVSLLFGDL